MRNTIPIAKYVLACAGVMVAVLLSACNVSVSQSNKVLPTPQWHVGDWWEVEIWRFPLQIGLPIEMLHWGGPFRERYEVVGIEEVEGYQCYKLKQRVIREDVQDEGRDYFYLNVADLSMVKVLEEFKKRDGTLYRREWLQTPGYPSAPTHLSIKWWCVFPLVAGERKGLDGLNEYRFRRADGSIKTLSPDQTFVGFPTYQTQQDVTVENLDIGGKRVEVFRVRFLEPDQNGQLREYANMRWVAGVGFPIYAWTNKGCPMHMRLVASSQKLPFEIPRLRVEGLKVLDEVER